MRTKRVEAPCDYRSFANPYTALAAMIFMQADTDLKALGGEETQYKAGAILDKWEIINFLRSPWAEILAAGIGVEIGELRRYTARVT